MISFVLSQYYSNHDYKLILMCLMSVLLYLQVHILPIYCVRGVIICSKSEVNCPKWPYWISITQCNGTRLFFVTNRFGFYSWTLIFNFLWAHHQSCSPVGCTMVPSMCILYALYGSPTLNGTLWMWLAWMWSMFLQILLLPLTYKYDCATFTS